MILFQKGKLPYFFFILLTPRHEFPAPQIGKLSYFFHPSPFEPYLTADIKKTVKQVELEGFLKKHRDVSSIIATTRMEYFVALVGSF